MYFICYTYIIPRKQVYGTCIRCNTCKNYTQCIEPVVINKELGNRFHFKAVCVICNKFNNNYLNLEQVKALPNEILDSDDGSIFTNTIISNNEILYIIPLIGSIAMKILTLHSTDSITANIEELKNNIIKNNNNLQTVVPFIIAILPEIIKTMPEEANKIKHLINGEDNKSR